MDGLKAWALNVGIKKLAPSLIRAALAWIVTLVAAHQGILSDLGITHDSIANTITLNLNQLQVWLGGAGVLGIIAAFSRGVQHHTEAAITKQPQDGTHIRESDVPQPKS